MRIGRVGRPHGNEGEFSVNEPTERDQLFEPGRNVWLGGRPTTVSWRKGTQRHPLLKVEGVNDREDVRALTGTEILAPREALGPLAPGEYLIDDLMGMEVVDGERPIGRVVNVVVLPSVEALEVTCEGGEPLLVPLVRDAVRAIDVERSLIDVDVAFVEGQPELPNGD